ncbi:hypothetical protein TrLO_g5785 [Triparma laevis f. longispina]|uniref:Uncharacterized protein n=1 Tax=Triparma laevis f. longispina TaxID=1714387 RepID=A0A9W7FVF6_9STRA|nr:hypothetical protein TrLO_g5785 [Triparma laevis f. longispina]
MSPSPFHIISLLLLLPLTSAEVTASFGLLNPLTDLELDDGILYSIQKAHSQYNFVGHTVDIVFHPIKKDSDTASMTFDSAFNLGLNFYNQTNTPPTCSTPGSLGAIIPANTLTCYRFEIDELIFRNSFRLKFTGLAWNDPVELYSWAFFEELEEIDHSGHDHGRILSDHLSTELSETFLLMSATSGSPFKPTFQSYNNEILTEQPKEVGEEWMAYVACVLVNFVTLIGVFFTLPLMKKLLGEEVFNNKGEAYVSPEGGSDVESNGEVEKGGGGHHEGLFAPWVLAYSSAFSAGAILSTTFMLVVPEAINLIWQDKGGIEEIELEGITWYWGTCLLAGFLFPYVLGAVVQGQLPVGMDKDSKKLRTLSGVIIGDFFHNFTDGTFIAAAFMSCSTSFGWAVAVSSIIHELAQEIADFFLLTTVCGYSPWKALFLNFLAGTSVTFGCMIVTLGGLESSSTGYVLMFGGGTYISIGAAECMPIVFEHAKTARMQFMCTLLFIIGATAIGLILLDHKHCEVGGGDHEGHNH